MIWDGLFLPLLVEPAKHVRRLAADSNYRWYCLQAFRLAGRRRYHPETVRLGGKPFAIPDVASFLSTYRDVFVEQGYRFEFPSPAPRILDLGANIGLSVLYFKTIFPDAVVTAYEADPAIFSYLESNVRTLGLFDVELVQGAVWHEEALLRFRSEGADAGRVACSGGAQVNAFDIRKILASGRYDVIKMDIEGAEAKVFPACSGLLDGTSVLFIEYHSLRQDAQNLDAILRVISGAGFRYYIESVHQVESPVLVRPVFDGFDLQLNIFAWKE